MTPALCLREQDPTHPTASGTPKSETWVRWSGQRAGHSPGVAAPLASEGHLGAEMLSEPWRPPSVVSHVFCSPGPLTSAGKGEGHSRADLFSTSPAPLRLSLGEPEMDTRSRVVWVAGNSTKFSKTVAGGGPACSEPNSGPSGLDL